MKRPAARFAADSEWRSRLPDLLVADRAALKVPARTWFLWAGDGDRGDGARLWRPSSSRSSEAAVRRFAPSVRPGRGPRRRRRWRGARGRTDQGPYLRCRARRRL